MVRFLPILVVLFLGHAAAQDDGISACSAGCISQVFSDTTKLACASNDPVCACNSPDFWFAIRDCINQACDLSGQALDDQLSDAQTSANTQCDAAKASAGVTAPSSTTSVPTTAPPQAPVSSPSPSPSPTTDTPATTATTSPTTGAITSTSNSATAATTATTATTATPAATSTSKTSSTSAQNSAATQTSATSASSTMATPSTASNAASTSSSAAAASTSDSSSTQLSVAAKAGIGAGAGVALLLSAIIACYILSRKRKAKRDPSRIPTMQISRPLPGSGRQYAHDVEAAKMPALSTQFSNDHPAPMKAVLYSPSTISSQYSPRSLYAPSRPSREDDHDVLGRRYEDMLPRTKPRTMI
ncbi:putative Extracellular membrane protein CFEM domain-containing protein [Seiridium cardinale]